MSLMVFINWMRGTGRDLCRGTPLSELRSSIDDLTAYASKYVVAVRNPYDGMTLAAVIQTHRSNLSVLGIDDSVFVALERQITAEARTLAPVGFEDPYQLYLQSHGEWDYGRMLKGGK